jgi:hypothetical protein
LKFQDILTAILKTIGVVFLVGAVVLLIGCEISWIHHHRPVNWHYHAAVLLLFLFCLTAAYSLIQPAGDSLAATSCPRCHALGGHLALSSFASSHNALGSHFGGFLFNILYASSRPQRFRCRECETSFEERTSVSQRYQVLLVLLIALIANYLWLQFSDFWYQN